MTKARLRRLEPRDIGDGAERDKVEQVEDRRLGRGVGEAPAAAQLAQQRDPEQERHSDRGEVAVRRALDAFVEPVGVDQRDRGRQRRGALVVVADDHLEPRGGGLGERFERLRAAIDGDGEARALRLQFDQRRAARAIALHQPVGDIDHRVAAEPAQQQRQQRRRGRAIDVIVAEDGDPLSALDGVGEAPAALSMSANTEGSGRKWRKVGAR